MLTPRDILIYFSLITNGEVTKIVNLIEERREVQEEEARPLLETVKAKTLTIVDRDYPDYLRQMVYPPIVLYYYGDISLLYDVNQNISVVGTREPSEYGKETTAKIVRGLSKKLTIVSGLARGIDGLSHAVTLSNNGKTIAVLGCGIDFCYPPSNLPLYRKIKAKGLLISEYPNDLAPQTWWFLARNRLIAGMGKALVVTEAKIKSGTATTVEFALQQGKEIYCIPHHIGEESGCNALIHDGAVLVESAEDIFMEIEELIKKRQQGK